MKKVLCVQKENKYMLAFRAAFPYTLPIFAGFWLGLQPYFSSSSRMI